MDTIDITRTGNLDNLDLAKAHLTLDRTKRQRGEHPAEYTGTLTTKDGERYTVNITGLVTITEAPAEED